MVPVPNVHVTIELDHSCNWRCCWGCKHQAKEEADRFEKMKAELDKTYEAAKAALKTNPYQKSKAEISISAKDD